MLFTPHDNSNPHQPQLWQILAIPQNVLVIVLVPILNVTPVCHASTTHMGFVRIALLNGPLVPCTTPPLVLKLQKTLIPDANRPKRNPMTTNNHLIVPPHHHVVSANLTLHTTLKTDVNPSIVAFAAALAVALLLDHPVMIVTMMITKANPHVHAMTILLGIMIFLPILLTLFMIAALENTVVLMVQLLLMVFAFPNVHSEFDAPECINSPNFHDNSSPLPGADNLDHSAWHSNPDKNPFHHIHFDGDGSRENPITKTYDTTYADYLDDNDEVSCPGAPSTLSAKPSLPAFDVCNFTNPETKQYSYWSNTKPDAQPPAGLMYFYVALYYR